MTIARVVGSLVDPHLLQSAILSENTHRLVLLRPEGAVSRVSPS